ncbi:DUF2147 domain-containing protein [Christiangramia sp. OXR-203]|jgi:uncharacterized protein (DUF2147 family)|uniref:DUF2147 domain-containing protein n=1 Tax=Christiangramia sp. OXR-203 TaxID=3100176 RepID=UPI002AC98170|nr:DUF2147 domain-containing protein [Christiangramia sp. OXR-203]WPY97471.1 DUF2147 domain-containing protein [Christiangramia sp. OXR-203]
MRKFLLVLLILPLFAHDLSAQDVLGKWENRNEEGVVNSIIEVYEKDGKIYGKVDRIMREEDRDRLCTKCEGDLRNKPVEGMEIMQGLVKDGEEYSDGTIVDPKTGKEYRCKIWIDEEEPDVLNIRGYIALFYQTRTWQRAE